MKKKLNEIFDEAKPQEFDQFSDELNAPELPEEVLASVKGKVYAKTNLKKEMKTTKSVWLRFGAIAACFLLIVSAVIVVPMLRDDDIGIKPYIPNGDPWSPVIDSSIRDIVLSADEVGNVFDAVMDSNGTNQYTKIYTSLPEYLGITPLPNAEFLPIYSTNKNSPSKSELNDFIAEYLYSATELFGINEKDYEIEKDEMWNGDVYYEAIVRDSEKSIHFVAQNNIFRLYYSNYDEKRLVIKGEKISILETDSDEQIKEKLDDTISFICTSFGKDYSNIKIYRDYSYQQLKTIRIYLYSTEETIFPSNFSEAPMTSDYVSLTFYTDWGSGTMCDWGGSKDEAFLTSVSLYQTSQKWNDYYTIYGKAKVITLEEAEGLLEKGYVFGGHSCPLCMAAQPEVDFSDYTCVDIEYVSDENGEICIPFYAFYKYIGKNEHGIATYAKTYVSAVQVGGYEEYFESQKDNHKNNWYVDEAE